MAGVPGGLGPVNESTPEVQEIADKVRHELEEKSKQTFTEFTVVGYKTQVVAGINYFIKVNVGNDSYVHLRVYQDFAQNVSLTKFELNKKKEDEIKYME